MSIINNLWAAKKIRSLLISEDKILIEVNTLQDKLKELERMYQRNDRKLQELINLKKRIVNKL